MKKNYIIALITLLTLASCGKSKEEIELEKAKVELEKVKLELVEKKENEIKAEKQRQIQAVKNEQIKQHEQKINVGKQKRKTEFQNALNHAYSALTKAKENYNEVNSFHLGRSVTTKNKQLNEAQKQINEMSEYVQNVKNEIAELELIKTFEFQKSPLNVVNHLFFSAKNADFSKLRYLCDPYAECDNDVERLCFIGMLPKSKQDDFIMSLKNGRIIGNPIIKGDIAEVEFAFGQSANRLEKMTLINRMGYWYLSGF